MTWAKTPEIHVLATAVIDGTPSARHAQGRGRAADLDLREVSSRRRHRSAISRVRLDAGAQLLELRAARSSADAAARHRVGRQAAGRHADDRAPRPRRRRRRGTRLPATTGSRHEWRIGAPTQCADRERCSSWQVSECRGSPQTCADYDEFTTITDDRVEAKVSILRLVRQDRTKTASFIAAGSAAGCRKASSTAGRSSASATPGRS